MRKRALGGLLAAAGVVVCVGAYLAARPACLGSAQLADARAGRRGPPAPASAPPPSPAPASGPDEVPPEEPELSDPAELDLGRAGRLLWSRGSRIVKGERQGERTWWRELDFPVADVRRGPRPNEALAVSVDGLRSARIDADTGVIRGSPGGGGKEVAELIAKAQRSHAKALRAYRADEKRAVLAECERLARYAGELSRLGRREEAWKVWAAEKKLRHAVTPRGGGVALPPEEEPGDVDVF